MRVVYAIEMISLLLLLRTCIFYETLCNLVDCHSIFIDNHVTLDSFSWSSCGSSGDSVQIQTLAVEPDPVIIPGEISMQTQFSLNTTLQSPLQVSIEVKKKVVFVWIEIPCEDNIGSCSYSDICQLITRLKCPQAFRTYGLPCECPFPAGKYNLPMSSVLDISKSLPSWLESGNYKVSVTANDGGSQALCVDLAFTVAKNVY